MKKIDAFRFTPIIDITGVDLMLYTNPIHGESGTENMDLDLDDIEKYVIKYVIKHPTLRRIIANRIREYANDIERGELKGYISDVDGYDVPDTCKVFEMDWDALNRVCKNMKNYEKDIDSDTNDCNLE